MKNPVLATLFISSLFAEIVHAQSVTDLTASQQQEYLKKGNECKALKLENKTTKCIYDLSLAYGVELPTTVEVHGEWLVQTLNDPMTDQSSIIVSNEALVDDGSVKVILRCNRGDTDAIITWPSTTVLPPKESKFKVRTRIDSNKPTLSKWRMAEVTPNAAFYDGKAISFINTMIDSERMLLEPESGKGTDIAEFDTASLNEALSEFRSCSS